MFEGMRQDEVKKILRAKENKGKIICEVCGELDTPSLDRPTICDDCQDFIDADNQDTEDYYDDEEYEMTNEYPE